MSHFKKLFVLIPLLLFITVSSVSQDNKPHIINLYKENYKADNKNWSIDQDEQGIMYFGNNIGLLEFDGIEWKLNQLPGSQIVRSVAAQSNKTIFTGSYEEFGRWDRDISGELVYTSLSENLDKNLFRNNDFWKIWITDSLVYFQSFSSIFVYDYKTIKTVSSGDNLLFLAKVRDELLVQKMYESLYKLDGTDFSKIEGSDIFSNTDVRVILPYSTDQFLIGTTTRGVFIYDGKSFTELNRNLSAVMIAKELNCGIYTSRGTYLLGTILDGIYEVDNEGNITNHISSDITLQNNTVLSLFEDESNNIWAALDKGISYIQYIDNMSCYTDPGGNTGAVYDAAIWDNKLFIGTNQGVFYITKEDLKYPNALKNMKLVDGTQGQVWSFARVGNKLYCCHNRDVKEIHNDLHVSKYYTAAGVYRLTEANVDGRDLMLLSTYVSLTIIDKQTGDVYDLSDISEPIINTEVDHLGNIWLEHANRGIYRCKLANDMKSFSNFSYYGGDSKDGLPYKMKIFKVGGRVVLLGDDKFYTYDDIKDQIIPDNLLNNCFDNISNLKQIVAIYKNTFWAVSDKSLYKFFYDGYDASIFESYDLGMNLSFVNAYENISILNDSTSLICLDNGFLIYRNNSNNDSYVNEVPSPSLVSLQTENAKGEAIYMDLSTDTEVPYDYNTVTFGFSAKGSFTSNFSFQYMLVDVDNNWSVSKKVNNVSYARLPKGKYIFMIRTVDNLGNFSEPVYYNFEILAPWYRTVWAYLLYVLIIAGILYIIWIFVLRRYRNLHLQKIRHREIKRLKLLNKELQSEVEQKKAELLTQTSFIIQKNELIMKIKDVVYDLYEKNKNSTSISLYQKVNSLLNNNMNSDDDWKMFLIKFEEKHNGFFRKMKILYPQLTNNDLRLCACLRLNLETKEIASLMNLSIRTVENSRYKLRKKLNLSPSANLNEFFMDIDS